MSNNKKYNYSAFSLLETIIVLFIVSVGLVSILSLTVESQANQNLNKNSLIAYHLASEGLDLINNVRDTNWLENSTSSPVFWNRYIEGSVSGNNYRVDYANFEPTVISDISEAVLQLSEGVDLGFYLHATGSPNSIFSRMITITSYSSTSSSSTVISLVKWLDKGQNYQVELKEIIYDWKY